MFSTRIRICDAFGIPVYLDMSLVVLFALFVWEFKSPTFGLACAMVLALSITLHELGHALTARAFGYETHDITLSLLGGCASLVGMPRKAYQEFLVALAGPLVSFVIAGIGLASLYLPVENDWLGDVLAFTFWMNLILGVFNLLPGFPMDGGRIFRSVVRIFTTRVKATYAAMVVGRVFAVLLAVRGVYSIITNGPWGFVSVLIAWMIWREGWREYVQAAQEERWGSPWEYSARVSRPPYDDGDDDEVEVRKK